MVQEATLTAIDRLIDLLKQHGGDERIAWALLDEDDQRRLEAFLAQNTTAH